MTNRPGKTALAGGAIDGPVVHIAPTPFFSNRGCHIRILNEYEALRQAGQRVIICTYGLGNEVAGVEVRRIGKIPGYTKTSAGFSPFKPFADVLLFFLVLKVVFQERAAIIHGHLHEGGLIGWWVKRVLFWRRIFLVMDVQGSLSGELRAYGTFRRIPWVLPLFYGLERLVLWLPDLIVCSSHASLDFLTRQCRISREKLEVVGDVVPPSFFEQRDRLEQRRRLGVPSDGVVVLYSGSLLPGKGVDLLLEAVALLLQRRQDVTVVLAGYPKQWIEEQTGQWPAYRSRLLLPGEVAYGELAGWLATADLAVDPKRGASGEASGKILHYMASGLPVVCFASENNRMFLGTEAFFVENETASALAAALDLALTDVQTRNKYGASGRDRAAASFSLAARGRQLADIYQRIQRVTKTART